MEVGVRGELLETATDSVEEEREQDTDHVMNLHLHLAENRVLETRQKQPAAIRKNVQVISSVVASVFNLPIDEGLNPGRYSLLLYTGVHVKVWGLRFYKNNHIWGL